MKLLWFLVVLSSVGLVAVIAHALRNRTVKRYRRLGCECAPCDEVDICRHDSLSTPTAPMFQVRYLVYKRPVGSACWTMAYTSDGRVCHSNNLDVAEAYAADVRRREGRNRMPMRAVVVAVMLPE